MRLRMILPITALALSSALVALPASAQTSGRAMNDGGFAPSQTGTAQYNATGQVVGSGYNYNQGGGYAEGASSCAQRFHSFDPATGTYLGRDGQRHPCQ
jgi:BA14K-like protein